MISRMSKNRRRPRAHFQTAAIDGQIRKTVDLTNKGEITNMFPNPPERRLLLGWRGVQTDVLVAKQRRLETENLDLPGATYCEQAQMFGKAFCKWVAQAWMKAY